MTWWLWNTIPVYMGQETGQNFMHLGHGSLLALYIQSEHVIMTKINYFSTGIIYSYIPAVLDFWWLKVMKCTDRCFLHACRVAFFENGSLERELLKFVQSSVHIVTRLWAWHLRIDVQFLAEGRGFYLLHTVHTGAMACSATWPMGNRVSFPGSKVNRIWR